MKTALGLLLAFSLTGLLGCGTYRETSKYQLANGYYMTQSRERVYVDNEEEVVYVYPLRKAENTYQVDTVRQSKQAFPRQRSENPPTNLYLRNHSFDVDFLTIPFKYRPPVHGVPRQFNTNLNGAVYFGYRNDIYHLKYHDSPIRHFLRHTTHYGFSFGAFTGLGGTAMNPTVTNDAITLEYDGFIWSNGFSGILGVDNVTIGLALGWDNLLDRNRQHWIYENKPWFGLAFGLNLN
ncbi:hypothetical protein [Telluribacter humicola]|uniref:hypothetical protein n=1 Tax=Telluribacter humicola TaxID=1720261 RepID=UPI001A9792F1|nr:hypothetical protein [Telluribacter humicola]